MISIVIPLFNKEMHIKDTINCVLSQTFQHFELIIVNDGSIDNSASIVSNFDDKRIILVNQENQGVSAARNRGVKESNYEYIAFLDADDYWTSNHLEVLVSLIVGYKQDADVFVTNFARKYSDDRIIENRLRSDLPIGVIKNYFKEASKKAVIHSSCVCISKGAYNKVGGFDTRMTIGEDLDLWTRLARNYNIAYSPEVTEYYVQDSENNCSFTLPAPEKIHVYYLNKEDYINSSDRKYNKSILRKRTLRYLLLDNNLNGFLKILKKQWKNLI